MEVRNIKMVQQTNMSFYEKIINPIHIARI